MELEQENKTYSTLAAGAALVFFPLSLYQNYKNKQNSKKMFKTTEVCTQRLSFNLVFLIGLVGFNKKF